MQKKFGLIGFPLTHSFSKQYFTNKFEKENIEASYELFEIQDEKLLGSFLNSLERNIRGFNITIPFKESIIPHLDVVEQKAKEIGAVNVVKIQNNKKIGFNSDYYGFKKSLDNIDDKYLTAPAMILGSGGASKAVQAVLKDLGIKFNIITRINSPKLIFQDYITYRHLDENLIKSHGLIINTTPVGMYPEEEKYPDIPYQFLDDRHFLYDLIYNPEETLFLKKGKASATGAKNGLEMLYAQAEKSWEIWNDVYEF